MLSEVAHPAPLLKEDGMEFHAWATGLQAWSPKMESRKQRFLFIWSAKQKRMKNYNYDAMSSEKEQSTKVSLLWLQQCLCMFMYRQRRKENGEMKTLDMSER